MSGDIHHPAQNQQEKLKWQPSILVYLLVMNFILLCLLFPTLAVYLFRHEASFQRAHLERTLAQMRRNIEHRGSALAHSLALSAGQAIAGFNYSFLNVLVNEVVSENDEIEYCFIMDPQKMVLAHNDPEYIGQVKDDAVSGQVAAMENKVFLARLTGETKPTTVRFIDVLEKKAAEGRNIMEVVAPVYSGGNLAGFLRCGYSLNELENESAAVKQDWDKKMTALKGSFIFISVLFLLVGGVVAAMFTRTFVRSMRLLNDGVEKISKGDLTHRISMDGIVPTEFTRLSDSFNSMTDKLRLSYEQLEQYSRNLEQKVEERTRDLQSAQANLLRQAHEAGMAEMAVGILHNIGNAITPAKVSTALLIKRINESRIRRHIRELMTRVSAFIDSCERPEQEEREQVKQIISVLPEALIEEYEHLNSEIKKVRDKHEHIEAIIHLQLRYARLSGDSEKINANKVLLDSLAMLDELIVKHSVHVEQDLDPDLPVIRIDQSKLLQVLVNLIKNGVEAMRDMDPANRQLVVITRAEHEGKSIAITIKDSGIGFDPEIREKLFTYGYTTKKTGSGFGLHSCANFLIAHRGSIEARSEGTGKGAEFTVILPVAGEDEAADHTRNEKDRKQNGNE